MGEIPPFTHTLDHDNMSSLEVAYEKATIRFQGDDYADLRQIIARRIIAAAQSGERDPERLSSLALASLGLH
jgi:hypothetical protein